MGRSVLTKMVLAIFIISMVMTSLTMGISLWQYIFPPPGVETYITESGTHVTIIHDTSGKEFALFICSPILIIVTVVSFFYWRFRKRHDDLMEDLPSYLKMYRRVKLEKIAGRMGITMKQIDSTLKKCIKTRAVQGDIDSSTGEFVWKGTKMQDIPEDLICSNCGASIDAIFLEGEVIRCNYCNHSVIIPEQ